MPIAYYSASEPDRKAATFLFMIANAFDLAGVDIAGKTAASDAPESLRRAFEKPLGGPGDCPTTSKHYHSRVVAPAGASSDIGKNYYLLINVLG